MFDNDEKVSGNGGVSERNFSEELACNILIL
jgi:hypothetical protein